MFNFLAAITLVGQAKDALPDDPKPVVNLMDKLGTAIIGVFSKIGEVINTNMPLVVDFFATYGIFLLPFILVLFFMVFKIFEKLLGAVR